MLPRITIVSRYRLSGLTRSSVFGYPRAELVVRMNGNSRAPLRLISELQRPRATLARSWRLRGRISFFSRLSDIATQAADPEYTFLEDPQRRHGTR